MTIAIRGRPARVGLPRIVAFMPSSTVRTPSPFPAPLHRGWPGRTLSLFSLRLSRAGEFIALRAENMGKRSRNHQARRGSGPTDQRPAASRPALAVVGLLGRLGIAAVPHHGASDLRDRGAGAHFAAAARHRRPLLWVRGPDSSGDRSRLLRTRARPRDAGGDGPARVRRGTARSGDPLPGPLHAAADPLPPPDRAGVAPVPRVEPEGTSAPVLLGRVVRAAPVPGQPRLHAGRPCTCSITRCRTPVRSSVASLGARHRSSTRPACTRRRS